MFVGRDKELARLKNIADLVIRGEQVFVVLEGSAGMGKTALLNKFKKSLDGFDIYEARGEISTQYVPYSLFLSAFNVESILTLPKMQEFRKARDIGVSLKNKHGLILVDELNGRFSREILKILGGGLIISSLRDDGILITELDIEGSIKPYEIDSKMLERLISYLKSERGHNVLIENINYLIYTIGLDKVLLFLRDLQAVDTGLIIVSGDFKSIDEENFKKISAVFSERYTFRFADNTDSPLIFTQKVPAAAALFSDKRGSEYWVSEASPLRPSMPNFRLLEEIIKVLNERDVAIQCLRSLIDYNTLEEIYVWLKYVRDVAMLNNRHVYVDISDISASELDFFRALGDVQGADEELQIYQYKIYENIVAYLKNAAEHKPIAVIMEDIQWGDMNSLDLLDYIARNIPRGVLFIIDYRGEEIALTKKAKILKNIFDYENTEIIRLGPLKKEDAIKLMKYLGIKDVDKMYTRTGGHPLLITELAKFEDSKFMPDTVAESIEYQLSTLDDNTLYILRYLSAFGFSSKRDYIDSVLGEDWDKNISNYEDFLTIGQKVQFKNAMVWSQIYSTTSPDLRAKFHRQIGEYFLERSLFKAAYHLYRARDKRAVSLLVGAAKKSVDMYALENAIEFYKMAIDIADKYNMVNEKLKLLELVGDLERITGRYREALGDFRELLSIRSDAQTLWKVATLQVDLGDYENAKRNLDRARELGDKMLREKINATLGSLNLRLGKFSEADIYYQQYLKFALQSGNRGEIAEAYTKLATLRFHQSRYREGLKFAKMAMEYARSVANYQILISVYNILGVIYDVLGKPQEALEKYNRLYELSKKAGDLRGMAFAYNNIGILYYTVGSLEMVKEYLEKAMELHVKIGDMRNVATSYYNLGGLYGDLGDFKKSIEYFQRAIKIYNKLQDYQFAASAEIWLGMYMGRTGDYDEAMSHITKVLNVAKAHNYIKAYMMGIVGIAKILVNMGKYEEALNKLKSEAEIVEKMKSDMDAYPAYLITLCEAMVLSPMYKKSENCLKELEKLSKANGYNEIAGNYYLFNAILKEKNGYDGKAEFEKAVQLMRDGGYISSIADSYYLYGKVLMGINKMRGIEYLRNAKNMYLKMGLDKLVNDIEELCGEC